MWDIESTADVLQILADFLAFFVTNEVQMWN
jgi:hypothetical protein